MPIGTALTGALAAGLGLLGPSYPIPQHLDWQPYRTAPFTAPAGQTCAFTLHGEAVADAEEIATLRTFPDGTPRVQVIRGDLRVRYTNVDTGAALERDLDGVGVIENGADGSVTYRFFGPAAVGFRPTDRYPAGFYALDGYHVVYTAPERAYREMRVDLGTEHDICADLD
jgi:hypothetical protein